VYLRIGAILLAILSLGATSAQGSQSQKQEKRSEPEVQVRGPILGTVVMTDFDEQYEIELQREIKEYLDIQFYLNVVYPEQQAIEAYLWAIAHPPPPPAQPVYHAAGGVTVGGVTGDCSAVAAIVGSGTVRRESGGNPLAENGIYKGCAQIGMPWWNGPCAGLNWTNVSDQATCAQIVLERQGPSAWQETWGG
jgi:hypothetical protein